MKLPSDTIIDPRKVVEYLLRPAVENDKSNYLALAGYTPTTAFQLLEDTRTQLLPLEAEVIGPFQYGVKYVIRGFLRGPNGRTLPIRSIWATLHATGETHFVTLYPSKP